MNNNLQAQHQTMTNMIQSPQDTTTTRQQQQATLVHHPHAQFLRPQAQLQPLQLGVGGGEQKTTTTMTMTNPMAFSAQQQQNLHRRVARYLNAMQTTPSPADAPTTIMAQQHRQQQQLLWGAGGGVIGMIHPPPPPPPLTMDVMMTAWHDNNTNINYMENGNNVSSAEKQTTIKDHRPGFVFAPAVGGGGGLYASSSPSLSSRSYHGGDDDYYYDDGNNTNNNSTTPSFVNPFMRDEEKGGEEKGGNVDKNDNNNNSNSSILLRSNSNTINNNNNQQSCTATTATTATFNNHEGGQLLLTTTTNTRSIEHDITQLQLQKNLLMKKLLQQQQQQQRQMMIIEQQQEMTLDEKKGARGEDGESSSNDNNNKLYIITNPSSSTTVAATTTTTTPLLQQQQKTTTTMTTTKQETSSTVLVAGGGSGGDGGDAAADDKGGTIVMAGGGKACNKVVPAGGHILPPLTTCPIIPTTAAAATTTTTTATTPFNPMTMSTLGGWSLQPQQQHNKNKNHVRDHGLPSIVEVKTGGGGGGGGSLTSELGTTPRRASVSSQGYISQGSNLNKQNNSDGGYRTFGAQVGSAFAVATGVGGGGGGNDNNNNNNNNNNNGGQQQQQTFLDGHFAGGWQSNADLPDRRRMNFHIIKVIEHMRPDANRLSQNRLTLMAKKLEDHLYRLAHTKEEYVDLASLKRRLHLIAKAISIACFNDGGEDGSNGSLAGSTGMIFNQNALTIEAMARASWLQVRHQQHDTVASSTNRQQEHMQSNASQNSISTMSHLLPPDISINSRDKLHRQEIVLLQQQRRLLLLRHASKCTTGPTCPTTYCSRMVKLWKHMKKCRDASCNVSHCLSSRCVLNHYLQCKREEKTASCLVCGPVMKHIRQNGDNDVNYSADEKGGGDLDDLVPLVCGDGWGITDPIDSSITAQLNELDEFENTATAAPAIVSKTGSGGDDSVPRRGSIPQLIGTTLQSSQTYPRDDSVLQQHNQPASMIGIQPQPQQMGADDGSLRVLQIELRKKQLLLTQVQQQMDNLFGQSQKLQHQLLMSASNLQQAQQLQQQQTILGQLNHQFEQQQLILQSEILHHMFLIQQYEQHNASSAVSNVNTSSKRYKNGNENNESHVSKKTKPLSVAEQCLPILKKLIYHEHGWVFKDPVDPVELGIPDYFDIVKHPMDLNLVMKKLGSYTDIKSFERDTKLVFTNAILFNGDESDVGCMAKELLDILVVDLNAIRKL